MTTSSLHIFMLRIATVTLVWFCSWMFFGEVRASEVDPNFDLYLLIGQSNMAGRGTVDAQSLEINPRVLMLDKNQQWVPAIDPLHFDKPEAGVGPGLSFGKYMAAANPNSRIGLIPCAVGGTSIKLWVPGAFDKSTHTHPYDDMLVRVKAACNQGVLKGILWHQGESDRGKANFYAEDLTNLVARLRAEIPAPKVPFLAGELAAFTPGQEVQTKSFNDILRSLVVKITGFNVVSSADLQHRGDHLHFATGSARILGERFAKAMLKIQQENP
jgi:Carbohydrate esterase, sialic acid-specific acetylesterase